jgi:hypothetical protein
MKIVKWGLLGLVAALLVVVGLTWRASDKAADAARVEATIVEQKSKLNPSTRVRAEAAARNARAGSVEYSLPPPNVPLSQLFPLLQQEADAGNPKAACRLGTEVLRCKYSAERDNGRNSTAEALSAAKPGTPEFQEYKSKLASIDAGIERDKAVCAGFKMPENLRPTDYLLKAAQAGHVPSQALYAAIPPSMPDEFFSNIDAWATYKENAPTYLASAARAGHRASIDQLADEHMGNSFFSVLRLGISRASPDQMLAAEYAYLAVMAVPSGEAPSKRLLGRIAKLEAAMQPEQLSLAKSRAAATFNSWSVNGEPPRAWDMPKAPDRDLDFVCEK